MGRADRFRLAAEQATSSGNKNESNSFKVPLVTRNFGEDFSRRVFAPEAANVTLDVLQAEHGCDWPEDAMEADGLVVLGGAMPSRPS